MIVERRLLFPAPSIHSGNWEANNFQASEFTVPNGTDTPIAVWVLEHPSPKATIIYSHVNSESLGHTGHKLKQMRDRLSANVVAYDYHGYGNSNGSAAEENLLNDAKIVGGWIKHNSTFRNQKLISLGLSLGGSCGNRDRSIYNIRRFDFRSNILFRSGRCSKPLPNISHSLAHAKHTKNQEEDFALSRSTFAATWQDRSSGSLQIRCVA